MRLRTLVALLLATAIFGSRAEAQTATQTVTFQVDPINQISVTGSPSLTVNTAPAGGAPTTAASTGATWSVTTNQTGAKLTGSLGTAMPDGVDLYTALLAPAGATSQGWLVLGTVAIDLVTGITKLNASGLALEWALTATAAAGTVASTTRVVTFTITGGV